MAALVNLSVTTAGAKAEFQERFDAASRGVLWPEVCTTLASNKDSETYAFLGSVPPMREWDQGRKAQPLFDESYSIRNMKYESTIEVDRDTLADDQVGALRMRIGEMAERAAMHRDSLLANLLLNGHSSGFNSYDGVPFFGTNHSSGESGAQSNSITYNATDHTAPTSAEIRAAFAKGVTTLAGLKDDQGEPMNQSMTGLILVVAPAAYVPALEALNATILASTTNVLQNAARVFTFPRLTDPAIMFLVKADVAVRPFVHQLREDVEFGQLAEGSSEEFLREKYYYGVRARYAMTYGYWQRAVRIELN